MNNTIRVLAEFACGIVGYKEYINVVNSGALSDIIVDSIPLDIFELSIKNECVDVFLTLNIMDKLREWCRGCPLISNELVMIENGLFDSLRLGLREAFSGVLLGCGITLAQANSIDCRESEDKQMFARLKDVNIGWENYPYHDMENFTSIAHLDANGFVYYIAAYMMWCIDNYLKYPYSNIASETFGAFDQELYGFTMRVNSLNTSQKNIVKKFLWTFAVYSDSYRKNIVLELQELNR